MVWNRKTSERPVLGDGTTLESLEEEIGWIQSTMVELLDRYV